MDLRQLRYFCVLAETLNFHRAAERLNISQPPLTVAIRKLESDLGARLFERTPKGVLLTAAGEAALPSARAAIEQAEAVRESVRFGATGMLGRLRIGYVGSAVCDLLPRMVSAFREAYPLVELMLAEMTSVDIVQEIASGRLDVGLVRLPVIDGTPVNIDLVETDTLVAALPAALAPESAQLIKLQDLAEYQFIMFKPISVLNATVRLACQEAGFTPLVSQEAVQLQTILSLVQAGLGVSLVPARTARFAPEGVTLLPLAEAIEIQLGIVRGASVRPLVDNFLRVARETETVI
jgi:DNA-binding transcriptional LysR family regulator